MYFDWCSLKSLISYYDEFDHESDIFVCRYCVQRFEAGQCTAGP